MHSKKQLFFNVCFTCHKRPERSFHYKGKPFPVCARCTGLGVGYILSFVVLLIVGLFKWWLIPLLILPTTVDGVGQLFNKWQSTNIRRFITGVPAGIGIFFILFYYAHFAFTHGQLIGEKLFH
ncbi:MAG: DUF2085 domain-containing protein [Kurthia sp.]|nr:DUF2085 domain-containing protein [Candidatus Kurthia equi]